MRGSPPSTSSWELWVKMAYPSEYPSMAYRAIAKSRTLKNITHALGKDNPRSTVRRNTRNTLLVNNDEDPFEFAIDTLVSLHLKPESTSTLEEKIEGIETIGHLSWTGGVEIAEYTGRKYLFLLVSLMSDQNTPDSLKLQIVKSVSEICYGLKQNQELARRTGKTKKKPKVIKDYNDYMLGVDSLNQKMTYYSFLHKSVRWWRKVFFWLLEATVIINRYIVYKEAMKNNGKKCVPHKMFRN